MSSRTADSQFTDGHPTFRVFGWRHILRQATLARCCSSSQGLYLSTLRRHPHVYVYPVRVKKLSRQCPTTLALVLVLGGNADRVGSWVYGLELKWCVLCSYFFILLLTDIVWGINRCRAKIWQGEKTWLSVRTMVALWVSCSIEGRNMMGTQHRYLVNCPTSG